MVNRFFKVVFLVLTLSLVSLPISAQAGRLLKCDGISTPHGFMYVGTYCVDYQCTYVQRYTFRTWCPAFMN